MKKRFFVLIIAVCLAIFTASNAIAITKSPSETPASVQNGVRNARFLNMLNHNFVYNETFDNLDDMINTSVPALLSCREDDFIAEQYVFDYFENMYGIEIDDMSALNADWPQKHGYLYIIPRGYSTYKHSDIKTSRNEDGSWLVETTVQINDHDAEPAECKAVSLFVENQNSDFGYNIIYSNLLVDVNEA